MIEARRAPLPIEYDVFVSHSTRRGVRANATLASVVSHLRSSGLRVFWDENCIQDGDPLMERLEAAIGLSRIALIVLTADAVESGWVEWEHAIMKPLEQQRRLRTIGLRLDAGCQPVARLDCSEWIDADEEATLTALCRRILAAIRNRGED